MIVMFCGNSQIYFAEAITNWLNHIIPSLIEGGAATFYLGGYGNFDRLAASVLRRQKSVYPSIESVLVLPYLDRKFDFSAYDTSVYPPLENVPPRFAIVKRNQWMVQESDVVISGVTDFTGGAARTLEFAKRKGKIILQLPRRLARS